MTAVLHVTILFLKFYGIVIRNICAKLKKKAYQNSRMQMVLLYQF